MPVGRLAGGRNGRVGHADPPELAAGSCPRAICAGPGVSGCGRWAQECFNPRCRGLESFAGFREFEEREVRQGAFAIRTRGAPGSGEQACLLSREGTRLRYLGLHALRDVPGGIPDTQDEPGEAAASRRWQQVRAKPRFDEIPGHGGRAYGWFAATDLDGDLITYEWTVDGSPQSSTSAFLSLAASEAGTHIVNITVSDGSLTDKYSWTVMVSETPPTTPPPSEFPFLLLGLAMAAILIVAVILLWWRKRRNASRKDQNM